MTDVNIVRSNDILLYDAQVHGYDTNIIKALSGTPTIASNKLRLNAAEISTYAHFRNCNVEFYLTIPAVPTSGDSRAFGLKSANYGNLSRMEFLISGTAFTAEIYNEAGTSIASRTINWDSSWTATATRFRIHVSEREVSFSINNTIKARVNDSLITKIPLFVHMLNSNSDNMDLSAIAVY